MKAAPPPNEPILTSHTRYSSDRRKGTAAKRDLAISRKMVLLSAALLLIIGVATWLLVSHAQQTVVEYHAQELALVVARQASSARSVYAAEVVEKLRRDGFGAAMDYHTRPGLVPLPAQYLKLVGRRSAIDSGNLYNWRPLSKWNLAEDQGLRDDFQRWGWAALEAQATAQRFDKPVSWQPVWRVEIVGGVSTLRSLHADPATAQSCVSCHNALEQTPDVRARRLAAGLPPGRTWRINELMGALEVQIPLSQVEALTRAQSRTTLTLIVGMVLAALVILGWFFVIDMSRARRMSRELQWRADHDSLTELPNRTEFERRLEGFAALANLQRSEHGLLFLDLDQFKIVNDTCGHGAGDELLRQLSSILQKQIRAEDTLARLGGDEFGVILPYCPPERAHQVAESLRQAVREFRFVWHDKVFELGVSIGLVMVDKNNEGVVGLMSAVDIACYVAKDEGRNRVHEGGASGQALADQRTELEWAPRILSAMREGRLSLVVQDAVALASDLQPHRYRELLLRMVDDTGAPVPTDNLISAAERYNLMPKVDRWVTRTACQMLAEGKLRAEEDDVIAINLSGPSLNDDDFLDFVLQLFREFKSVPITRICFEITETAAVRNMSQAARFMNTLSDLGCRFALDDFGTGLSSFGYLKHLPVDFLKVDGQFIRDITSDPIDRVLVSAMVQVGHAMGIPIIAEWVENESVLQLVRDLGIDYAQGYKIERPKPIGQDT